MKVAVTFFWEWRFYLLGFAELKVWRMGLWRDLMWQRNLIFKGLMSGLVMSFVLLDGGAGLAQAKAAVVSDAQVEANVLKALVLRSWRIRRLLRLRFMAW